MIDLTHEDYCTIISDKQRNYQAITSTQRMSTLSTHRNDYEALRSKSGSVSKRNSEEICMEAAEVGPVIVDRHWPPTGARPLPSPSHMIANYRLLFLSGAFLPRGLWESGAPLWLMSPFWRWWIVSRIGSDRAWHTDRYMYVCAKLWMMVRWVLIGDGFRWDIMVRSGC